MHQAEFNAALTGGKDVEMSSVSSLRGVDLSAFGALIGVIRPAARDSVTGASQNSKARVADGPSILARCALCSASAIQFRGFMNSF